MTQRRRAFSTLFGSALGLSALACSAPVQQAPKVTARPQPTLSAPVAQTAPPVFLVPVPPPAGSAPVAVSTEPSANEIIARVQVVYDATNAVKLTFNQRYGLMAYGWQKDSTGTVIAEKPSQSSWRYANGNRAVVGGSLVQVYEKTNNTLFVMPDSKSQFPWAMSFTFGPGQLERRFAFTKQDAQRLQFPSGYVVSGEPRKPVAALERVFFYVDGQSYRVRRVLLLDAQGNRNRYDFVKTELGVRVPPDEFHLEVPPGTQILEPYAW